MYSYTFVNFTSVNAPRGLSSNFQGGNYIYKQSFAFAPSRKIMLAEEQTSLEAGESYQQSGDVVDDGRFTVDEGDQITIRHGKRGDVGMIDGHVEAVLPAYWKAQDSSGKYLNVDPSIQ
jgi:prepilin-type processing-associated H-X9-DG protein